MDPAEPLFGQRKYPRAVQSIVYGGRIRTLNPHPTLPRRTGGGNDLWVNKEGKPCYISHQLSDLRSLILNPR